MDLFELILNEKEKITILRYAVEYKIKDLRKKIKIVSYEHLKIILKQKIEEKYIKIPFFIPDHQEKIYLLILIK